MKKNIYTDGISRMKTPDELLNKSIENIRSAEVTEEVISFKTARSKRTWIKPLSAIAASLAIVIALGSVGVFTEKESSKNPFVLTANADEINNEAYIQVGKLECQGRGMAMVKVDEESDPMLTEMGAIFDFNIECVGENIESVTYSADNTCLYIIYDHEGVLDYVPLTMDQFMDGKDVDIYRGGYRRVNACTFDYDMQPQGDGKPIKPEEYAEKIPLCGSFKLQELKDVYIPNFDTEGFDVTNMFIEEFNKRAEDFTVDITAKYTDGSTLTKTIQFQCQKTEDGEDICLSAMII